MYILTSFGFLIVSLVLYLYWSLKKAHRFFLDRNIPYIEPHPVFGNMKNAILKRAPLAEVYLDLYKKLSPYPFGGVFTMMKPSIIIRDPNLIKNILVKDFACFIDRGFNTVKEIDPLSHALFTMRGDEWKTLRNKLSCTFTSGKMKTVFPLFKRVGENLTKVIDQIPDDETFDAKDLFARFATDAICSFAFGLDTNSLNDPNSEFRTIGKEVFGSRYSTMLRVLWPNMPKKFIKLFKIIKYDKNLQDRFTKIVDNVVKYREQNNITRNDFLDLLIALKKTTNLKKAPGIDDTENLRNFLQQTDNDCVKSDVNITNDLLAALAFEFFTAGFHTTSTALSFALLELSLNESIQDRTRQEISEVLSANDGLLTYEAVKKMTYLDLVIDESLRKYPPDARLYREAGKNYPIPNTNVIIPAETLVIIPTHGIHLDEKYYDNPGEFRPERFIEEEKAKRSDYTFLPFGGGPRICTAERFARMQIKIGLIYALVNFSYRVSPDMKFPQKSPGFGLLGLRRSILLQKRRL